MQLADRIFIIAKGVFISSSPLKLSRTTRLTRGFLIQKDVWFFIFHTPFGEIFSFVGSSLVRIGFLPFGIYKILAEKLSPKMPKSLEKSRLFGGASFLFPFYGASDGT